MDPPPLLLTIRFSTSHPDLPLDIPSPRTTSLASLKLLIRTSIPTLSRRRLRFIHQGRILKPDSTSLASALDPRNKGKSTPSERIFLNCSIGDVLSPSDLEEEARTSKLPPSDSAAHASSSSSEGQQHQQHDGGAGSTRRRRRGFDRLLDSGFSAGEVNQLRLQFRSIHEARHTPDTMPSHDTLLDMEDAWIDNNGTGQEDTTGEDHLTGGGAGGANAIGDVLDVFLQGIVTGFFMPMASMAWLLREGGLWSKRRQVAVFFGVLVSVIIGLFKTISGEAQ